MWFSKWILDNNTGISADFASIDIVPVDTVEDGCTFSVIENGSFNTDDFGFYTKANMTTADVLNATEVKAYASGTSYRGELAVAGIGANASVPLLYKTADGKFGMQTAGGSRTIIMFTVPRTGTYTLNTDVTLLGPQETGTGTFKVYQQTTVNVMLEGADGTFTSVADSCDFTWEGIYKFKVRTLELTEGQRVALVLRAYPNVTVQIDDISFVSHVAGEEYVKVDADNHALKCAYCDAIAGANESHNGGTATCKTQAVCADCGESYGELNASNHEDVNGTWTKDENGHSFNRTCCDATDIPTEGHNNGNDNVCDDCGYGCNHTGGTATCKTQAVCGTCGASYGELDPNNHELNTFEYEDLGDGHKVTNECCGATVTASEDHDYIDGVCDLCGHACTHTGGNATCTDKAVCDDCGEEYGDTLDHDYVDGFCTVCGDEDPNYVPPVNPDTGDNFLAYALLIAGLGLLGVAFIPSKKRR